MRHSSIISGLLIIPYFTGVVCADAQARAAAGRSSDAYRISVSVDEVSLTFHADDAHRLPINDLKLDELTLLDNGKSPGKIVAFHSLEDSPIRAGILMDTSESMDGYRSRNRAISIAYAQRLLRERTDEAFVMDFNSRSEIAQRWTSDTRALTAGIRRVMPDGKGNTGSTAIFDSLYRACLNQFGVLDHTDSGNFILLFSVGEDNASHASLEDAVDICQTQEHGHLHLSRRAGNQLLHRGKDIVGSSVQKWWPGLLRR